MAVGVAVGVGVGIDVGSGVRVAVAVAVGTDVGMAVGLGRILAEGAGLGSSEHPVSRLASTAVLTSRPMIDFDIDFTS